MANTSDSVERKTQMSPEAVPGPSSSNVADDFSVELIQGGTIRNNREVVTTYELTGSGQLRALRPDVVDSGASSDEDVPVLPKKQKKSAKHLHYTSSEPSSSKTLWDHDSLINCSDSGSEEEVEEGFIDVDDEMNVQALEEESMPIESNYFVLRSFRQLEKNRFLSMAEEVYESVEVEVQVERCLSGSEEFDGGRASQVANVEADPVIVSRNVADRDVNLEEMAGAHQVEGIVGDYEWKEDFESFTAQKEMYTRDSGPTIPSTCPYELFTAVWDESIMNIIVHQTNKYAWDTIAAMGENEGGIRPRSRLSAWVETNVSEMYVLFSIFIYMTLCYRSRLDEYWTTGILGMPQFRSIMSRDRFFSLLRFLHFTDNDILTHRQTKYEKKIHKISPILQHCNMKFQKLYIPKQHLSLDESLLLWKGKLSWKQCIRSKAARYGIKSFELCEAETGYLLNTIVDAGKGSSGTEETICGFENYTAKIVLKVADSYLDVGHILVMDNWYNQLSLTRYLKSRHTDVLGTLNRKLKDVPNSIRSLAGGSMPRGHMVATHCGDICIVAWKDVKLVTMVSTYHNNTVSRGQRAGQAITKPIAVGEYNRYMGGVNLKDQLLSLYPMERKRATKWYMKVFRRLVNTSLMNTFIMYKANFSAQRLSSPMNQREFRYAVADLLFRRNKIELPRPTFELNLNVPSHRLDSGPHNLEHIEKKAQKYNRDGYVRINRRRCARCSAFGRQRLVTTQCSLCNVGLCMGLCFQQYHTLTNLRRPDRN